MSPAEAWSVVFPNSRSTGKNAQTQCSRFLGWYKKTYPPGFDQVASKLGLTPTFIMQGLKDMMSATVWEWDQKLKRKVDTGRPDWKTRAAGHDRLMKIVEKSEQWRKLFLEQEQAKPTDLVTTPEFDTVEEFEEWAQKRNVLKQIEAKRAAATEARDRRLSEEGRLPMPTRTQFPE